MRRYHIGVIVLLLATVCGLAGCGGEAVRTATYLPVTVGSTWSYLRSDNGTQTQTITGSANNQVTRQVIDTTTGKTVATITIDNNAFYLSKIDLYNVADAITTTKTYSPEPGQLFLPASTIPGFHETTTVQVNTQPANTTSSQSIDITVIGFEDLAVPAGTFSNALKIQTIIAPATTYVSWFALNVGMIRQDVNNTKAVELTSYTIK